MLRLFVAHTPLQMLSATNIRLQYFPDDFCILIYEGEALETILGKNHWTMVYQGHQSRTVLSKPAFAIRKNLQLVKKILDEYKPKQIELFVSELQWMCNKAIYAMLTKHFKNQIKTAFFDEGLHFYVNNKHYSMETPFGMLMKFIWMRLHRLPSKLSLTYHYYKSKKISALYCYHPHLIQPELYYDISVKPINIGYLDKYISQIAAPLESMGNENEILFLSQAYYFDIPETIFKQIVIDMVNYFKSQGIKRFLVKPHHSDKPEWINYLIQELGFELAPLSKDVSIEIYAKQLHYRCIVSMSSSALLNLPLFGYRGKLVSYGLERCNVTQRFKRIHQLIEPLLIQNKIQMINESGPLTPLRLFLVHTPLQLLAATNVRLQYFPNDFCILIHEGEELAPLVKASQWTAVYQGLLSRTVTHNPSKAIRYNLQLLKKILDEIKPSQVELFISELQWMCNKAFYSALTKQYKKNLKTSFFDEGLHFYINNKNFSEETRLKTILKFIWMKLHKFPSNLVFTNQYYQYKKISALYCYHPQSINPELYYGITIKPIQAAYLEDYTSQLSPLSSNLGNKNELLLLSQAYYWDIPESIFKKVILDLVNHFKSLGVKRFVVKPHHSDKPEWITYLTQELKFELMPISKDIAIEVYAKQLNYEYIASISSSALLNLPIFGYQGKVVSYGSSRCSLTPKFQQIHNLIMPLFKQENVEIVD